MAEERLGRYVLQDAIGQGAMGMVYRAQDPLLERDVAIKTIRLEATRAEQDDFEERFLREAKSAGRLSHPGIVTVYDAGEISNVAYIAMEYLQGQDLRELIRNEHKLAPEKIADIAAQVADALEYAHKHGVVHRDVKPGNIMVLPDGKVKLMDFGIARMQTSSMTQTGIVLGTPKYMSPELVVGGETDGRTDIYSLGVVLYQMLTGSAPFESSTIGTTLHRIMHDPAPHPSTLGISISPGFEYILNRALSKKPEKRYAHASEMAIDLRRIEALDKLPRKIKYIGLGKPVKLRKKRITTDESATGTPHNPTERSKNSSRKAANSALAAPDSHHHKTRFSVLHLFALWGVAVVVGSLLWHYYDRSRQANASINSETAARADQGALPQPVAASASPVLAAPTKTSHASNTAASVPKQPAAVLAQLNLAVIPWGEVLIDGKTVGVTPPLREIPLPAGQHRIEIRNGSAPAHIQTIRIEAGEQQTIRHKF